MSKMAKAVGLKESVFQNINAFISTAKKYHLYIPVNYTNARILTDMKNVIDSKHNSVKKPQS